MVAQRLCLLVCAVHTTKPTINVGGYRRWSSDERATLLDTSSFFELPQALVTSGSPWPKLSNKTEMQSLASLNGPGLAAHVSKTAPPLFVHRIVRYFVKALNRAPLFIDANGVDGKSDDYKVLNIETDTVSAAVACLNSSLFYWYWRLTSDGFHCGYGDIYRFPFNANALKSHEKQLNSFVDDLLSDLDANSVEKTITTKAGKIRYQEFRPKNSKAIIDEIDKVLATAFNLPPVAIDFLINYDIKYRLGQQIEGEDD